MTNVEGERCVTFQSGYSVSLRGSSIPFRERTAPSFNTLDFAKIELRANLYPGV